MDHSDPSKPTNAIKSTQSNTVPIRIHKSTAKLLHTLVTKLNRKTYGRKIKPDQIIAKAISLLTEKHFEEIKVATYDSKDQLEIEFKKYCKQHGSISKDDFLKRILTAALPQVNQLSCNTDTEK